jgi:hypothetical protein
MQTHVGRNRNEFIDIEEDQLSWKLNFLRHLNNLFENF